jgi:two-component system chemotaxis response regulator CheY
MKKEVEVLFVDDDEIFLKVLSKYFQIQHPTVRVHTGKSGEECLDLLQHLRPDLLVLDYHLNSQNRSLQGAELLRAIRKIDSAARIVVLSGREKSQMMPELMKENVEDYIVKDMNSLAELDRIVGKYFG